MKRESKVPNDLNRRDAIRSGVGAASLAALGAGAAIPTALTTASVVTTDAAQAQQASRATTQVSTPVTGIVMHPDYARTIAQMAYVWGWPIVNMINRKAAITQAPTRAASMACCRSHRAVRSGCSPITSTPARPS
jgi:hypothetical protein